MQQEALKPPARVYQPKPPGRAVRFALYVRRSTFAMTRQVRKLAPLLLKLAEQAPPTS